jgi:hypothetical protein
MEIHPAIRTISSILLIWMINITAGSLCFIAKLIYDLALPFAKGSCWLMEAGMRIIENNPALKEIYDLESRK